MAPPDKITQANEVVRKHRSKRRMLRSLRETWRKKEKETSKPHGGGTTESDDSESESLKRFQRRLTLKHEMFTTKRDVDQSAEGAFLRRANKEMLFSDRLLPPAEEEDEDEEENFEEDSPRDVQIKENNFSAKSKQRYDLIYANLDKCSYNVESFGSKECVDELTTFFPNEEPLHFFDDDDGETFVLNSMYNRIKKGKNLSVKFADECGKDLELIHYTVTLYSEEENDWVRTIILLLSPRKKMFEFLHVAYNVCDKTSISDVLKQLPNIATDSALKEQRYVGLLRKEGERELINTVSIQSYGLSKDEILIAVVSEHHGKAILRMAKPLLENQRIMKAVSSNFERVI